MNTFTRTTEQLEARLPDTPALDFAEYWRNIRQYQWRILAAALVFTAACAVFVMSLTPMYVASASLLIEADKTKLLSIEEVYGLDSNRKEYFQTQYEILRSRHIAERVVDKLDLSNHPSFQPSEAGMVARGAEQIKQWLRNTVPFLPQVEHVEYTAEQVAAAKRGAAISRVRRSLTITPVKNTQVVTISFESASPQLSATVANTVADVYIENYLEAKFNMTSKATTWLNDSLQGLRGKLTSAEQALASFYEKEQLVNIDGVVGLAAEEVQILSEQLLEAQNTLKQYAASFEQFNILENDFKALSELQEVQNNPSIQSLQTSKIQAETRVSELSRTYGPKHPRMITAKAELTSITDSLSNQLRSVINGLQGNYTTDYRKAREKVLALRKELDAAKQQYRRLNTLDNTHRALQREVDITQQLYDSFFTRLKETNELGGFESANARLLDEAKVPSLAAKPKKKLMIIAAFVLSVMVGVMVVVLKSLLDSGIKSVEDVERRLGQRMLGIVPKQKGSKSGIPLRHFYDTQQHVFSEAIRTIRTHLLQQTSATEPDGESRVVLVASSVPKEGKTTVAVNLSFALAQLGDTLIIDADLRRPQLAKAFGLPGYQPGVANLISQSHTLEECIIKDEYSGVDILPAGTLPANPQELLASHRFSLLVDAMRQRYKYIVMDTAPTQAVSDALVVAAMSDALLYVVKADGTADKTIMSGVSRFVQMGHKVDGVVLNQVDLRKAAFTGNYDGFYDQYGYREPTLSASGR